MIALAAGVPIVLVIAWAFEMKSEGMKRTENVLPNELIPQWSRRKFASLTASVALGRVGVAYLPSLVAPAFRKRHPLPAEL